MSVDSLRGWGVIPSCPTRIHHTDDRKLNRDEQEPETMTDTAKTKKTRSPLTEMHEVRKGFSLLYPADVPRSDGVWAIEAQVVDMTHPFVRECVDVTKQWHKLKRLREDELPKDGEQIQVITSQGRYRVHKFQKLASAHMTRGLERYEGTHPESAEEVIAKASGSQGVDSDMLPGLAEEPSAKSTGAAKTKEK